MATCFLTIPPVCVQQQSMLNKSTHCDINYCTYSLTRVKRRNRLATRSDITENQQPKVKTRGWRTLLRFSCARVNVNVIVDAKHLDPVTLARHQWRIRCSWARLSRALVASSALKITMRFMGIEKYGVNILRLYINLRERRLSSSLNTHLTLGANIFLCERKCIYRWMNSYKK